MVMSNIPADAKVVSHEHTNCGEGWVNDQQYCRITYRDVDGVLHTVTDIVCRPPPAKSFAPTYSTPSLVSLAQ